jgi:hypothetical protein
MFRWFEHSQVYHPSPDILADGEVLGRWRMFAPLRSSLA